MKRTALADPTTGTRVISPRPLTGVHAIFDGGSNGYP